MMTTRESEFERAYKIKYFSEFGYGSGLEYGRGYGAGYGAEYGLGQGFGSFNSKKDLIDDDDS